VYPEDRVLVGVINRKRDLEIAQTEHWYRVPYGQAMQGIHAEYIAFFLSRAFKDLNGSIPYYARRTGIELVRRRDLFPAEAQHPRADALYHKLQLGDVRRKEPPIRNTSKRAIAFIYTTWDRFSAAETVADLYSEADRFVDRVFHALERAGVRSEPVWEATRTSDDGGAQIRIECEDGTVIASTAAQSEHIITLVPDESPDALRATVDRLLQAIKARGGPLMIDVPLEE